MSLQIANAGVINKVVRLANATGLSKTAAVERAVDRLLTETEAATDTQQRMRAVMQQFDRIPDRGITVDPLQWDAKQRRIHRCVCRFRIFWQGHRASCGPKFRRFV